MNTYLMFAACSPFEAGKGGHPGDDGQASPEHTEAAGSVRLSRRSSGPQQVPGGLQRVCERGRPIPRPRLLGEAPLASTPRQLHQRGKGTGASSASVAGPYNTFVYNYWK